MKQDWEIKKLGEVCTIKGRIGFRGYTREDLVEHGEGAITLSPSNIIDDKLDLNKCQYISWHKYEESPEIMISKGDVIFAKTASIGKVAVVEDLPEKATINPQFVVFKNISCSNYFLYYAVRGEGFKHQIASIINGVAIPTVSQSNLSNLTIPIPPLSEQEQIVAELDLISGIIKKKKQQLKELDSLAQSLFYEMFGNPVENDKGWEVKKLGEVVIVKGRVGWKGYKKEDLRDFGVYAIGGSHITENGEIDLSEPVFLSREKYEESPEIMVQTKDLILVQRGTIGKIGLVKNDIGEATINPCVLILRPINICEVYSLYYFLNYNTQVRLKGLIRGVAQPMITQQQVNSLNIPIPPLSLQQEFASRIEKIEKQKELIKQSLKDTETLFNSRMDFYFN